MGGIAVALPLEASWGPGFFGQGGFLLPMLDEMMTNPWCIEYPLAAEAVEDPFPGLVGVGADDRNPGDGDGANTCLMVNDPIGKRGETLEGGFEGFPSVVGGSG